MSPNDKSYCRCVAHVAAKKKKSGSPQNVYGACRTHSPPDTHNRLLCVPYYKYEYTPSDEEMEALAEMRSMSYEEYKEMLELD